MQGPSPQDRTEIYELYARYRWALDTGDTEAYVALFSADGEAIEETREGATEVYRGREAIRRLALKFHGRADFPGHQHQMAQFLFEPDLVGKVDGVWRIRSKAIMGWAGEVLARFPSPESR